MPIEFSRTTARKRITLPNGKTVNVPIITKLAFNDPRERYQEYQYDFDNSAESPRIVHVDNVPSTQDSGTLPVYLLVERIDKWKTLDAPDRGQETESEWDNRTGADSVPPHFSTHLKTHVVRYKNQPDDGNWIDSELIDNLAAVDPSDRHQETIFVLLHPQGTFDDQGHEVIVANTDDPDLADTANGIDPPWRTDPFQNIVNFGATSAGSNVCFQWVGRWSRIIVHVSPDIAYLESFHWQGSLTRFAYPSSPAGIQSGTPTQPSSMAGGPSVSSLAYILPAYPDVQLAPSATFEGRDRHPAGDEFTFASTATNFSFASITYTEAGIPWLPDGSGAYTTHTEDGSGDIAFVVSMCWKKPPP